MEEVEGKEVKLTFNPNRQQRRDAKFHMKRINAQFSQKNKFTPKEKIDE
jgi:hypothetical protein